MGDAAQGDVAAGNARDEGAALLDADVVGRALEQLGRHLRARVRTSRVVRATAGPAFAATRLPPVPMPIGKSWVSPATMWTSSSRTPSSAAQIWARVVWCPWPCAATPMVTNTWPLGSTRTCAPS